MFSTAEVQKMLKISRDTWKKRYDDILEYLSLYWDYEIITKGRSNYFNVKEEYGELEPLPRKTKTKEIKEFYKEETDKIVKYNPWNSGSNIARQIIATENKYDHVEGTAANYVRPVLKEGYMVEEKKWMKLNYTTFQYEELSQEEETYLQELFVKHLGKKDNTKEIAKVIGDLKAGLISKEEGIEKIADRGYNQAMEEFKNNYGFRPTRVGKYETRVGSFSVV